MRSRNSETAAQPAAADAVRAQSQEKLERQIEQTGTCVLEDLQLTRAEQTTETCCAEFFPAGCER